MFETLDDRTAAYVLETRRPFEDLRQVASQLAALLVLEASGGSCVTPDHPMLDAAREMFKHAADDIRRAQPSDRSASHHRHLLAALPAIDDALRAASMPRRSDRTAAVDAMLTPLKAGYSQLQEAADRLPGFELVAFGQGCCATGHSGQAGQVERVGQVGPISQLGRR